MTVGGVAGKGNRECDRGKGHKGPLETHLEFEEGSQSERGDNEGVTQVEGREIWLIKMSEIQITN